MRTALPVCAILTVATSASALPVLVYENDFESDFRAFTASNLTDATAQDGSSLTMYHGDFFFGDATTLSLDLTGIDHAQIALEFDLYLFGSWDGVSAAGPDSFVLSGDISFRETFTNHAPEGDSYPGAASEIYGTGTTVTHVYRRLGPDSDGSEFLIDHTSDLLEVTFAGGNLSDEWWGIDNVRVTVDAPDATVPLPGGAALLATALLGFGCVSRLRA